MALKIGNKVRNIHDNTEGRLVHSSSGASIIGRITLHDGSIGRFQTLGRPIHEYEKDWKRIYKYKYTMKEEVEHDSK